jgi:serine/threonine-protein kinase
VGAAGVREGDVLVGKYRVDRVLGVGGMGVVVAAHHLRLDEKVAIKLLRPEAMAAPEAVVRFEREARAAVKIKSEHVARVIDVGALENGAPYMVMEYLEGSDLSAWLTAHGKLPIEEAVEFVLQACEAIAEAHAMGIIHRDLKPANLFCVRRPDGTRSIKVLDFGISKVTGTAQGAGLSVTRTQAVLGSPLYMSPEQLESSKGVDTRADIWGLGIILYQLLTGVLPFASDVVTELAIRIVNHPTPPVRALRPDVPPGLEAVVLRCLEKDRDRRYPNIAELARSLVEFAPPRALLSLERIAGVAQAALGSTTQPPSYNPLLVSTRPVAFTAPTMAIGPAQGTTPASWAGSQTSPLAGPTLPRRSPAAPLVVALAAAAVVAVGTALLLAGRAPRSTRAAAAGVAPSALDGARLSSALRRGVSGHREHGRGERHRRGIADAAAGAACALGCKDVGSIAAPRNGDQGAHAGPEEDRLRPPVLRRCRGAPPVQEGVLLVRRSLERRARPAPLRFASLVAVCAGVLWAGSVHADTKTECFDGASQGQTLRDRHELVAARAAFTVCARQVCPKQVSKDCTAWLEQVEQALPTVVVSASDPAGRDRLDVTVLLDGRPFASKLTGQAVPVDPGYHTFHFEAADGARVDRALLVREGLKNQAVAVVLAPAPMSGTAAGTAASGMGTTGATVDRAVTPTTPDQGAPSLFRSAPWRVLGFVAGGLGLAGLGVGTAFGLKALSDKNAAQCDATGACQPGPLGDARAAATVSTVGFVVGGVLLAGGAALVLLAPELGPREAGIQLTGRW